VRARCAAFSASVPALLIACAGPPIVRHGAAGQRIVARTYAARPQTIRAILLDAFATRRSTLPSPFNQMAAHELGPPRFPPEWLAALVDPGGFVEAYARLPPELRRSDLLLDEQTGDAYWPSEYATASGPIRFRCGLIVHFGAAARGARIEVYETVPTVWVGEHWAFSAHGIGFGRYHDIRFVEPTMAEREHTLDLIDRILDERR
jgi:hypothetical protein